MKNRRCCCWRAVLYGFLCFVLFISPASTQTLDSEDLATGQIPMDPLRLKNLKREMPKEVIQRGYFDWRDETNILPSGHQGSCGGCWAFAVCGVLEAQAAIHYGYTLDLSEQFLLACDNDRSGCCGGNSGAFTFLYDTEPVLEQSQPFMERWTACSSLPDCPTDCTSEPCSYTGDTLGTTVLENSLYSVDISDFNAIVNSVFINGPMLLSYSVHTDFKTYWRSPLGTEPWPDGIYVNYQDSYEGGHGVVIIGYDTDDRYLICKNSWGAAGGPFNDGTFKIAFDGHEIDGILWSATGAELDGPPNTPTPTPSPTPTLPPPPNDDCGSPENYNVGQCICGRIEGATDHFDCSTGEEHNGGDRVYHFFNFDPGSIYQFRGETEFNADWGISTFCSGSDADILCANWAGDFITVSCGGYYPTNLAGELDFQLTAEQNHYYVWVDSFSPASHGEFCLEVECIATATPTPLPGTIIVPDDYSTIEMAIANARDHDTILIRSGVYSGPGFTNLSMGTKNLIIVSEHGPGSVVIDGENTNYGFVINGGQTDDSAIRGILFQNCVKSEGAAISCIGTSPIIAQCRFFNNEADDYGGAVYLYESSPWIADCTFQSNIAGAEGGALYGEDSSVYIVNSFLKSNFATNVGGALAFDRGGSPYLRNVTCYANSTDNTAGGISVKQDVDLTVQNSILYYDDPGEIWVYGGTATVSYSDVYEGYPGTGNISDNPDFVAGPHGNYYLDQVTSPCIDAGAANSQSVWFYVEPGSTISLDELTTSAAYDLDSGTVDMGYHYPADPPDTPTPTPSPSPTPTSTSTPTNTPFPTNTPDPVNIYVPDDYATIQAAVDAANPGMTVIVADGIWTGNGNREISISKELTIRSNGNPELCVIDCESMSNGFNISDTTSGQVVVHGFKIQNGLSDHYGGAFHLANNNHVEISNCVIEGNSAKEGAGLFCLTTSLDLVDCLVMNNTCYDLYQRGSGFLGLTSNVEIENCLFTGNSAELGAAITMSNITSSLDIRNSTIADNQCDEAEQGGVWLNDMLDSTIENSIIYGNSGLQFNFSDITVTVSHCNVGGTGVWPGSGNINSDPEFVAGTYGNYYLDPGVPSNCIDSGTANASTICFQTCQGTLCQNQKTTDPTDQLDLDTVDMGYHYPDPSVMSPTPTPTAIPTNTPIPTVIYVPADYPSIEAAMKHALSGDTVIVADGTWSGINNTNIEFMDRDIKLISENGPFNCIIDGGDLYTAIRFDSDVSTKAILSGFTIQNCAESAILCNAGSPNISNCIFNSNTSSTDGGAIRISATGSPRIINCLFDDNSATDTGGAISCLDQGQPRLMNCTFHDNSATACGGALAALDSSIVTLSNSIVWNNTSAIPDNESFCVLGGSLDVTYSDIETNSKIWPGTGNINTDPLFVSGLQGDFYLIDEAAVSSPCLDIGSGNSSSICFPNQDTICLNDLTTHVNGIADGGIVDLGFHYPVVAQPTFTPPPTPTAECVHNGDVDFSGTLTAGDAQYVFNVVLGFVTPGSEQLCPADCNGDGSITAADSQTIFFSVLGMGNCEDALQNSDEPGPRIGA